MIFDKDPRDLIAGALIFAGEMHKDQKRASGKPYIQHPIRVALRVQDLSGTPEMVAAAYLHDIIEDTMVPLKVIHFLFGIVVAKLVNELTNASKLTYPQASRAERKRHDRERIAKVSPEAKLIKLVDRIDNLRELDAKGPEFAKLYKAESLLLLNECLRGIHAGLEKELEELCQ